MSNESTPEETSEDHYADLGVHGLSLSSLAARGCIGGVLMGLANLVPGISGGTMLLATGVYPGFIAGIAELTTLRFRLRSILLLASIVSAAALGILLLAGFMRDLVIEQRWIMYSLFIGLTLGGVPLVWRLARPATPAVFAGAAGAFLFMLAMQLGLGGGGAGGEASVLLLGLSGLAGAAAMILPGVSGGYLLLLLGQYEVILGAIDTLKQGLLNGPDLALIGEAMWIVVPVGIGVVLGVVGVSNLLKWLLEHYEKATLGVLLGLLLGAVVGLWPFQQPVEPELGSLVKGRVVTEQGLPEIDVEDWPLERFQPSPVQLGTSLGMVLAGLSATLLIAHIGRREDESAPNSP
jgi:putative membrane protein